MRNLPKESFRRSQNKTYFLLGLIFCFAFALRVYGLGFGLPYLYHVDEPSYVVAAVRLGNGIPNSHPYDPTGFGNILFAQYGVFYLIGRVTGLFGSIGDFVTWYETDQANFYLLARLTSAFLGTATVATVFILGSRIRSRLVGILAAAFLALCFLHVRNSHYGTPDIAVTFFVAASVTFCVLAVEERRLWFMLVGSAAGALAIATKWLAVPVIAPLILTAVLTKSDLGILKSQRINSFALPIELLVFALAIGLGSFQIILNPMPYIGKLFVEYTRSQTAGYEGWYIDTSPGWFFYIKTLLSGFGAISLLLAIIGGAVYGKSFLHKREMKIAILLTFPFLYFLIIVSANHFFARYILPLVPFLAIFAAEGVSVTFIRLRQQISSPFIAPLIAGILLAVAVSRSFLESIRHDVLLTKVDTRTIAKDWIEENIPVGSKIAVDWSVYAPPLYTGDLVVPWVPTSDKKYDVVSMQYDRFLHSYSLEWYCQSGFDYLIASSFVYNLQFVSGDAQSKKEDFYASVVKQFQLIKVFSPYSNETPEPNWVYEETYGPATYLWQRERPGPTLKIYRVPPCDM